MKDRSLSSPSWMLQQAEADLSFCALMQLAQFRANQTPHGHFNDHVFAARKYAAEYARRLIWC